MAIITVYPVDTASRTRKVTCLLWDKNFAVGSKEFFQKYGETPLVELPLAAPAQVTIKKASLTAPNSPHADSTAGSADLGSEVPFVSAALAESAPLNTPLSDESMLYYVSLFNPLTVAAYSEKEQAARQIYSLPFSQEYPMLLPPFDRKGGESKVEGHLISVNGLVDGKIESLAKIAVYPLDPWSRTRKVACKSLHTSFAGGGKGPLTAVQYYQDYIKKPGNRFRTQNKLGAFTLETCPGGSSPLNPTVIKVYAYSYTDGERFFTRVAKHDEECLTLVYAIIQSMFDKGFGGYTFYSHKDPKFDTAFMLRAAAFYKAKGWFTEVVYNYEKAQLLSLKIGPSSKKTLLFRNSQHIASGSLEQVAGSFGLSRGLDTGAFPVSFVNTERLSYVGVTPDAKYYSDPAKRKTSKK